MEINYNDWKFSLVIEKIAKAYGSTSLVDEWILSPNAGTGFLKSWQFDDDISVMVMNCSFQDELFLNHKPNINQHFSVLNFFDLTYLDESLKMKPVYYIQNSALLSPAIFYRNFAINSTVHIPANTKIQAVLILFHRNFIHQFIEPPVFEKFISNYYYRELHGEQIEYIDSRYRAIMNELINEHSLHPITNQFIYSRTLLLIEKLIINFCEKLKTSTITPKIKVDEVTSMIQVEAELVKDFSEPAPLISSLSKMSGMSPTKFKKQFRNFYGLPVFEYYQKHRMMFAKNLLKQGTYSIQEVGNMVSYTNLGHFAAAFKKEFGMLPKDWLHAENKMIPLTKD